MINLLPPHAKRRVKIEYWTRVVSVWFLLVATGVLIVAILHIPLYVLLQSKLAAFSEEFDEANVRKESFDEAKVQVIDANRIAKLLVGDEEETTFTQIVTILEETATSQIFIDTIELAREEGVLSAITVSGTADTRQSLVAFRDGITANEMFEEVELPLSNLAKDSDIPFALNITPVTTVEE